MGKEWGEVGSRLFLTGLALFGGGAVAGGRVEALRAQRENRITEAAAARYEGRLVERLTGVEQELETSEAELAALEQRISEIANYAPASSRYH